MSKKIKFKAKNQGQETAIDDIRTFIDKGSSNEFHVLEGKAGTGKTTIIQEALHPYIKNKRKIIIGALSHKAKLVLSNKINARFKRNNVGSETIASMLAMSMDMETGRFSVTRKNEFAPIAGAEIVVIDECSMVNEEALEYVMKFKPNDCKIIFAGDIGQLPPIRDGRDIHPDVASPTFSGKNKSRLMERVRQGEESPILPYADLFWNNSQSFFPVLNPADPSLRVSTVTDKGSLVFSRSGNALNTVLPLYREAVDSHNFDIVRTIAYRNNTREILNRKIREFLFTNDSKTQFVVGDLIIFQDTWESPELEVLISNSTECQVRAVKPASFDGGWKGFNITIKIDTEELEIPVLAWDSLVAWNHYLQGLAQTAKGIIDKGERSAAWRLFWSEKERFAPVEHAYAITSHKSQGSTYDTTLIAEADIMAVSKISNKCKSQSVYTSITRSKHLSIVMDGTNDHPNQMHEAFNLLKTQRTHAD